MTTGYVNCVDPACDCRTECEQLGSRTGRKWMERIANSSDENPPIYEESPPAPQR
jgi:hypothetical protein